jgi:hypothetical protein
VSLKNIGRIEVLEIINENVHLYSPGAEGRAKDTLKSLSEVGRYWPEANDG